MRWQFADRLCLYAVVCACAICTGSGFAHAFGGGAERTAVIIDPNDADSVAIGNHYVDVRRVPSANVIYLDLDAADYLEFASSQIPAFLAVLEDRGISGQIDFVTVASSRVYRYPAMGFVTETASTCPVPVDHISLTAALATARFSAQILAGDSAALPPFGLTSETENGYFGDNDNVEPFRGASGWLDGDPTGGPDARRFFVASMLGYTGPGGNSVDEILAMIDRSEAADGTLPAGSFYYMMTNDIARTAPRSPYFDAATNSLDSLGGDGIVANGLVPPMGADVLGVMTGTNAWSLQPGDINVVPGAFCEHLTSFGGFFDNAQQTKISEWVRIGASGSFGTVEEPCALAGKFPHPRMHVYYFQGLSLGEAVYRSLEFIPFQGLVYGDPLTRPFTSLPDVTLPNPPPQPASGVVSLLPAVTTMRATDTVDRVEAYIDGVLTAMADVDLPIFIDTSVLPDGVHRVHLVAVLKDNSEARSSWRGFLATQNKFRSVTLDVTPTAGDMTRSFLAKAFASGGSANVREIRILQNQRVVASIDGSFGSAPVAGFVLGEGSSNLIAEALFDDGEIALSGEVAVYVDPSRGACCLSSGRCRQHSQSVCESLGGSFSTNGVACNAVNCATCQTGDFDSNGSIDLVDFNSFAKCFSGDSNMPIDSPVGFAAQCLCTFDFDGDTDVDEADTAMLEPMVSGPRDPDLGLIAYPYTVAISDLSPLIIDLPGTDSEGEPLSVNLIQSPPGAIVTQKGNQVLFQPLVGGNGGGVSTLGFSVESAAGVPTNGQVQIEFAPDFDSVVTLTVEGVGESVAPVTFSPTDEQGATQRNYPFTTTFASSNGSVQLLAADPAGVSPFERWVVNGTIMPIGMNPINVPLNRDINAVAAYTPKRRLTVKASINGVTIFISPDPDGVGIVPAPFVRDFLTTTLTATIFPTGAPPPPPATFVNWRLNGVDQPPGVLISVQDFSKNQVLAGIYSGVTGDGDTDGDVDLADVGAFMACYSGDVNSNGFVAPDVTCTDAFDLDGPDGDVDESDWAVLEPLLTGPF